MPTICHIADEGGRACKQKDDLRLTDGDTFRIAIDKKTGKKNILIKLYFADGYALIYENIISYKLVKRKKAKGTDVYDIQYTELKKIPLDSITWCDSVVCDEAFKEFLLPQNNP